MIAVHRDGAVATLAIARAAARNAVPIAGWQALADAARTLHGDDVAVVRLVSDVPGIFSAGADLSEMAPLADDPPARPRFRTAMRAAIDAVAAIPAPVIVAVDGGCYGAGVALVLAADIVVAGDGARFATTPARLGIGYPGVDVGRLVARVGRGQAARLLFSAEPVDADTALAIGLADQRTVDATASSTELAARIASHSWSALRLLKRTLADPTHPDADAWFDAAFGTTDFGERLAAFHARAR